MTTDQSSRFRKITLLKRFTPARSVLRWQNLFYGVQSHVLFDLLFLAQGADRVRHFGGAEGYALWGDIARYGGAYFVERDRSKIPGK